MTEKDKLFLDGDFHDTLDSMAERINPAESRKLPERGWKGQIVDYAILLRRGFQQVWQFLVIFQALFIFLGLSQNVSNSIHSITGIRIPSVVIGSLALIGILFMLGFGMFLLLIGGTQKTKFLVNQKQNPAQRMDYEAYRTIIELLKEEREKVEKDEERSI